MKSILHITDPKARKGIGNKAMSLRKLHALKLRIPETWVVPLDITAALHREEPASGRNDKGANNQYASTTSDSWNISLLKELEQKLDPALSYAIRSSGELEDSEAHSFAGQFSTFLDIQGTDAILDAIGEVHASARKTIESEYTLKSHADTSLAGMAVIIQEMVHASWSGVAFSINPITGRNECVFEAVQGAGTKLVEDGVNPERWIWHQGTWENDGPEDGLLKTALGDIIEALPILRKSFQGEVDIEWAYDGQQLWFLQCRPVTTSEYPTIYSNHISREVLPGMIKPLVWSVNIPLVNSAWLRLLEGLLGKLNIHPEQLSASYYYRAYFNMGTLGELFNRMGLPRDSLESLMGRKDPSGKSSFKPGWKTMKYMPTILGFMLSNFFLRRKFLKRYSQIVTSTNDLMVELDQADPEQYHALFQRLRAIASEAAYYNIIIPLAMQISNRMLQGKLNKRDMAFEHINFSTDFPALASYDPGMHIPQLKSLWRDIPEEIRASIPGYKELIKVTTRIEVITEDAATAGNVLALEKFHIKFQQLLDQFGHFSESGNDFSYTPWREDPEFLFNMVTTGSVKEGHMFTSDGSITSNTPGVPASAYHRAGRYRLYREMISSEYTRCYGLFRILFMKTGAHFAEKGWLNEAADVFYLTLEEHNALLEGMDPPSIDSLRDKISHVKEEMHLYRDVSLPSVIYGETPPPLAVEEAAIREGIPTSPGIFEGEIVVVNGYEDFKKEVEGRILVIPFSDIGWTPLLVKAGAIVSESGGMLSHASIIARELKIPAISSVDHACKLKEGTQAMIDGFNGKLILKKP